jgi:hypothetical protein
VFTEYGCKTLLSVYFGEMAPPKLFLALYRETGAGVKEVFGGGYERVEAKGVIEIVGTKARNAKDVVWPVARRDWGQVVAVALVTEDGEEVARNEIDVRVGVGEKLRIPAESLFVSLVNGSNLSPEKP